MKRIRIFCLILGLCMLCAVPVSASGESLVVSAYSDLIDMTAWQYNEAADIYWQVGIPYCETPDAVAYENLGIYVPGAYFDASDNGDGTYSCKLNTAREQGTYTAETAPIVIPVNTPGHSSMSAPTGFSQSAAPYCEAGCVYVSAGLRSSKELGMPAGVVDAKAAIRYIRANDEILPGSGERIFVFGMSGGGSQCAVLGASGDSELYAPYLQAIGASKEESDAVCGVMAWCPITGLDSVDLGHEWSMGNTRTELTEEMQAVSDALAAAYMDYISGMQFTDADGNVLLLEESEEGICQAGSYYDYVLSVTEQSLANYLSDNEFPKDGYDTPQDYVDSLNGEDPWVEYDAKTGSVSIRSLYDFSEHCKKATKPVAAFDKLESGGHLMFGYGDGEASHFDAVLYDIIRGTDYEAEFEEDFARADAQGNTVQERLKMFSPLTYLSPSSGQFGKSAVAPYWRIRSGIAQSDTPLTSELNLLLGLRFVGIEADFETVWALGHTEAERVGDPDENFIAWIYECLTAPAASGEASADPEPAAPRP